MHRTVTLFLILAVRQPVVDSWTTLLQRRARADEGPGVEKFVQDVRDESMESYKAAQAKDQGQMIATAETLSATCAGEPLYGAGRVRSGRVERPASVAVVEQLDRRAVRDSRELMP